MKGLRTGTRVTPVDYSTNRSIDLYEYEGKDLDEESEGEQIHVHVQSVHIYKDTHLRPEV